MRPLRAALLAVPAAFFALALSACGEEIQGETERDKQAATVFLQRCSGCHTLTVAASQGSRPPRKVTGGERTNGPNLNVRKESKEDVLYAIRNGGFSGAIMPANIVVGQDAELVAEFVAKYAGREPGESQDKGPGRDSVAPNRSQ